MQYVWQHRLWESTGLSTNDGRKIKVIDPGLLNTDSGPDFFNAKIEIDGEMWAGNVEIHVRASDWKRHNHDKDMAYDSIVLHVVEKDDMPVFRTNGERIPQCVMHVSPHFNERYRQLVEKDSSIPCASEIGKMPHILITEWMEALAFERLHGKVERIDNLLTSFNGSWEDVCYVTLARNLGFGINSDALERLSRRTPLHLLRKHSDSLLQMEALLFGQAGLLNPINYPDDKYYQHLCKEYSFLSNKFSLKPMEETCWKFFRIRPQNFPHRRIAMLAQLVYGGFQLFNKILDCEGEKDLRNLFDVKLSGYWCTHYTFGNPCPNHEKAISQSAISIILINTVVPIYYAYGELTDNYEITQKAIDILDSLKPEINNITNRFAQCGLKPDSALVSQALIQLQREYCEARKCIYCRIGHKLLSRAAMTDLHY